MVDKMAWRLYIADMESAALKPVAGLGRQDPGDCEFRLWEASNIFRPHCDGGFWHWTYHDEQGRLLVRGPEDADRWTAHRGLLDTIADYCTPGEAVEEEEEEPVAIETAALHAGAAATTTPASAPGTCLAAVE